MSAIADWPPPPEPESSPGPEGCRCTWTWGGYRWIKGSDHKTCPVNHQRVHCALCVSKLSHATCVWVDTAADGKS